MSKDTSSSVSSSLSIAARDTLGKHNKRKLTYFILVTFGEP